MFTYDTIPAKLYFKIMETGDISLMGNGNEEEIAKCLADISEERDEGSEQGKKSKELDLHVQIESLLAKYKAVQHSIYYLRQMEDADLLEMLKGMGYAITDDLPKSLDAIEKRSETLPVKIASIRSRLPKQKNENNKAPFDEVLISYCALLELGFVDTNTVTLSQYDSIITIGNKKMETLNKAKNGRK